MHDLTDADLVIECKDLRREDVHAAPVETPEAREARKRWEALVACTLG